MNAEVAVNHWQRCAPKTYSCWYPSLHNKTFKDCTVFESYDLTSSQTQWLRLSAINT